MLLDLWQGRAEDGYLVGMVLAEAVLVAEAEVFHIGWVEAHH